jgi:hypothetical protein
MNRNYVPLVAPVNNGNPKSQNEQRNTCECGGKYTNNGSYKGNYKKHCKTQKHTRWAATMQT